MQRTDDSVGGCSACGTAIPASNVLIRYERSSGETAMFAECPECRDVVHPR